MRVYYDRVADVNLIKGSNVAIIGYGSQGHAHALNLKDSGIKQLAIGLRAGSAGTAKAEGAGLKVLDPAEAAKWADVVMVLTPDEGQGDLYREKLDAFIAVMRPLGLAEISRTGVAAIARGPGTI